MVSQTTAGITGGFATGAAAGSVFGPWGAAVGGVVGGVMGLFGSKKAKKAAKYQKKAQEVQVEREQNAVDAQYLQMLREARMNRAGSLQASINSGIETSSLSTSALSSIGSQAQYNVQYLANDRRLFDLYSQYMQKAGKAVDSYQNTIAMLNAMPKITKGVKGISTIFSSDKEIEPFNYNDKPTEV